jgi:hypothetical protein
MNTSLIETLLMTLVSAIVCICLPRVLSLLWSKYSRWRFRASKNALSNSELSPSTVYSEFAPENPHSFPEVSRYAILGNGK